MRSIFEIILAAGIVLSAAAASAEIVSAGPRRILITGRKEVTVTQPHIQLGDIAEISGTVPGDDETVIGLKKIRIQDSPKPGKESGISAAEILERLRSEGVNLNRVGYTFPRSVTVRRASRTITLSEIQSAVERALSLKGNGAELKHLDYSNKVEISTGNSEITAIPFETRDPSRVNFDVRVAVNDVEEARFNVTGAVDEWKEIPIAIRTLGKGQVVKPEDVRMARLNVSALPRDAASDEKSVVGRSLSQEVSAGDFFKAGKLSVPPVVTEGQQITVRFRTKSLEATATGIALESGAAGEEIRVKNSVSKKIITGNVVEPGLVEIGYNGANR